MEYRYLIRELSIEFYIGIIAVFFAALGAWVGFRLTGKKTVIVVPLQPEFKINEDVFKQTGISKREYEVLELMSRGNSNQEIADKLFVSLNTVKTHTSNLFTKLDVKRRTQAIQRAKEFGLIP
ncbi:MAG: helix-turn-helix transcriptional regulator [Marivirga sp.]|nr:helix-turn-helix transcriptional regulator [Marivirga sp.]